MWSIDVLKDVANPQELKRAMRSRLLHRFSQCDIPLYYIEADGICNSCFTGSQGDTDTPWPSVNKKFSI